MIGRVFRIKSVKVRKRRSNWGKAIPWNLSLASGIAPEKKLEKNTGVSGKKYYSTVHLIFFLKKGSFMSAIDWITITYLKKKTKPWVGLSHGDHWEDENVEATKGAIFSFFILN